jgi:hypothetical protein
MRRILATALLLASASCSSDSSTDPTAGSLAGTWNLSTVNGAVLPFTVQAAAPKIEILNDQLIVSSAGTFTETGNIRFTDAGTVTNQPFTDSGTWSIIGNDVTIHFNSDGTTATGKVSGNTFTTVQGSVTLLYAKQ